MSSDRLLSLAAGVVQEFPAVEVIHAAASAGFNASGIWCEPASWSNATTAAVKSALTDCGIFALDIEVVWLQPDEPLAAHDKLIDIALALGAHNVLCVSSDPNDERTAQKLRHLCERAGTGGPRIVLEFLPVTQVQSLQQALDIVAAVDHPLAGILVDSLHLQRTGGTLSELENVALHLLPYLQICDAPQSSSDCSFEALMEEALYGRLLPGQGELPIASTLQRVDPALPLSLEIRSRALINDYPDSAEARAKAVMAAARTFFQTLKANGS